MSQLRKIRAVTPKQDYRLEVIWTDGTRSNVDFAIGVLGAGVLASLLDPAVFRAVCVGERARSIEWIVPADDTDHDLVDIDADALFAMAEGKCDAAASTAYG